MTDALAAATEFERDGDGYRLTTATFDARVYPAADRWRVAFRAPTIDAAVEGETVADVVVDGWYETFERRVADTAGVTRAAEVAGPTARRDGEEVVVEASFAPGADAPEEARALLNFVEGTWFQGVIPGYDYVAEVEAVRDAARRRGDA